MQETAINEQRLAHAREVLAGTEAPDWYEQPDAETLAKSKYAVTVARDDEEWVDGADNPTELAQIKLGTIEGPEYDVEWIESVVDLDTGEPAAYTCVTTVTVTVGNESASVSA